MEYFVVDDYLYTNELPNHIAYGIFYEDDKCEIEDTIIKIILTSECGSSSGGNYFKYSIQNNKLFKKYFKDSECTKPIVVKEEEQIPINECNNKWKYFIGKLNDNHLISYKNEL